jgi:hypothetical protein
MRGDGWARARRRGPFPPSASPNEERRYGTRKSLRWEIAELTAPLCSRSGPAVDLGPPNCGGGSAVVRLARGPPDRLVRTASWLVPASCQRVRPFKARTAKRPPQATTRMPRPTPCARACLCGGPGTPPCGSLVAVPRRTHLAANHPGASRGIGTAGNGGRRCARVGRSCGACGTLPRRCR